MIELRVDDGAGDELARERAIDPQRSILLQAPAGSGKTTVLTQRVLRLLAVADEPEQILAITFTRKAAAEMRARVLRALHGEIEGQGAQADRLRALAHEALQRSLLRGWSLLDNPGRLRVQTIDSFNFWLASQLPLGARTGGALTVAERPEESYRRAARNALIAGEEDDILSADMELLFERLDNSWARIERLLAEMLQRRGHWLRYVLDRDPAALRERIADSLLNVVREQLSRACWRLSPALRALAARVPDIGPLGDDPAHLVRWQRLAAVALTNEGEWRKPKGVNKSLGPAYESTEGKEALRECIAHWSAADGALEMLREIDALPDPGLAETDGRALEALSRVLRSASAQLQLEFAAAGRVDHTYIAGAARAALTEAGEPTDLALRAGLSLRHILVDEFQDTSLGQFDLLEALTAGWSEGDGRTLFVVGDPMQSIYQFREAEVGLFLRARERGIGTVRLEAFKLTRNFRSTRTLTDWSNESFAQLFPQRDDLRASAVAFTPSLAARTADGRAPEQGASIELQLFDGGGDRDGEAAALAQRIAGLKKQDPDATFAVLVASRSHAVPVMASLQAASIATIGVDLIPLGELSIVRDLMALTRALHHLGDRTAWLSVLRAPWCGVSLAGLTELSRRDDPLLVWEAMNQTERLQRCAAADRARIERIRGVLAGALAACGRLPLAEWLERIWLQLGAADAYTREELPHARAFFAALSERVASGEWRGTQDIETLPEELFAQPRSTQANPVQVMTIHRAKGLEFDHVFLPSLDRALNRDREPLLRWLDLPRTQHGSDLLMAPVPVVGAKEGGKLNAYLKRLSDARAGNERARLLYVAVTRAKQTLHLSAAPKPRPDGSVVPRSGTLLASLWPALQRQFNDSSVANVANESAARRVQPIRRLSAGWTFAELPPAVHAMRLPLGHQSLTELEFSWAGETLRHVGTVVHSALERFAALPSLPAPAEVQNSGILYRQQLQRLGVPSPELERATRTVIDALARTVDDERGRWIFCSTHREAYSELALTGIAGGRLTTAIVDRSFIDGDGVRWVVDFKTSRHTGGDMEIFLARELDRYRPQLETYAALARALGPEPVRAALYFPLLGAFREL